MKPNLKELKTELYSFPTMVKDPTSNEQDAITWHYDFLKKFEDFEKQLQEILKLGNYGHDDSYWNVKNLLEQILGEK